MDTFKNRVTVYLLDNEASKWILFQQHFETFNLLLEKKVFEQKSACIMLHFDHLGSLQKIQREDSLYDKRFDS